MKSVRNHLSLIIALLGIIFSIQIFLVVDRAIEAYSKNLKNSYSVIVVSTKEMTQDEFISINKAILSSKEISPDSVINKLSKDMKSTHIELLRTTLPKFYKLYLTHYPNPSEIKQLTKDILKNINIQKVEDFSSNHDTVYKLLLLLQNVVWLFSAVVFIVTTLLIFKELRIWQYKHNERMSIMGLFGAPLWLRSAVLFRLALVDALIASFISFVVFMYLSSASFIEEQLKSLDIAMVLFNPVGDFLIILGVAMAISITLASLIVIGHKEEV